MTEGLPPVCRRIIAADLFSDLGNQVIALFLVDLLVFKGGNAVSSLVVLCLIHQLPSILLSPLAGAGVDRLGPGRWMVLVTVAKCLLVGVFALVTARWAVFAVYLAFVTASLFFSIGRLSIIPLLMPRDRIIHFNAVNERVAIGGAILSPWLIGMILARTGQPTILALAALLFASAILLLSALPDPRRTEAVDDQQEANFPVDSAFADTAGSGQAQALFAPFFMLGIVILGGGILYLGMPLLFKTVLNGNIARWGFVLSAFQAGAFLSTLLLPRCSVMMGGRNMPAFSFLALGAAMFALPFVDGYVQLAGLMALFGCGFTLLQIFWESRIQQNSPPWAVGRTMSIMSAVKGFCYLGAVLSGAMISTFWGVESFLMIGAVVVGSASLVVRRV